MKQKIYRTKLTAAKCAVDLGVGSERGEYVNQDYILQILNRPHRAISLMYCYYPLDYGWPLRSSEAFRNKEVKFAWDYPYDNYFTYKGGLAGSRNEEPFNQMREIRSHGQDIALTLSIDPKLPDKYLISIAEDLKTFGRVFLRINHEATGNWFCFNKRASYQEVADFFVRAATIIKQIAPNVQIVDCIGGIEDLNSIEMVKEKEFAKTLQVADVWSVDKYLALHWGWPYDIAERGGQSHSRSKIEDIFEMTKRSYDRFCYLTESKKPMMMSELNADADVVGVYEQCKMVEGFSNLIKGEDWFSGFCFYQFRDKGGLGLEKEDTNNKNNGIKQPILDTYKRIISQEYFSPQIKTNKELNLPVQLNWRNSEDADGISIPVKLESNPVFFELYFEDEGNYIIQVNEKWFYKSPETKVVDLMPAFFNKSNKEVEIKIFAPPKDGENLEDYNNYSVILEKIPEIRLRYEPIEI